MSRLDETEAFVAVVQEGSFTAASERLGVSSSYVSKLVSRLEGRLGVRLLHRSTRRLTLTELGERYFEDGDAALRLLDGAEQAVAALQVAPRGRLRVSLPTALGLSWLSCSLAGFMARHPQLITEVAYLDRRVDLLAEGFDVAIRVGEMPDSELVVRRLASVRRFVVASPGYVAARGAPGSPQALGEHGCLLYSLAQSPSTWTLTRGDEVERVSVKGPLRANSGAALAAAASSGLGVAYLPEFHCEDYLRRGELVRLLPGWSSELPIQAVTPSSRYVPSKVRAFVDHLGEALRARADEPSSAEPFFQHLGQ